MTDFTITTDPTVVQHVKHIVPHVKHVVPQVSQGVSHMSYLITAAISAVISGAVSWYVGKMGAGRVISELQNDVQTVKKLVTPAAVAA